MAARTLLDLFGANASITSGVLNVTLADFTDVGLDEASPDPTDIAAALVLKWKATQVDGSETDPTVGLVVQDEFKSFLLRGDQSHLEYQYPVSLYIPDTTSTLDPDDVV